MTDRATRIRKVREINDLTQAEFATRLGDVERGAVGNWERGKGISTENLEQIAKQFRVSMDWLSTGRGPEPAPLTTNRASRRSARSPHGAQRAVVSSFDPDATDAAHKKKSTISTEGTHDVPPGEIPQVAARLGLGFAENADTIQIPLGAGSIAALEVVDTWKIPEHVLRRSLVGGTSRSVHIIECEGDSMEPRIRNGDFVFIDTSRRVPSPPGIFALNDGFGQTLKRLELIPNSEPPKVMIIPENPRHQSYERNLDDLSIIGRFVCRLTTD